MSFLKELTKEFKELKASLSGDKKKEEEHEGQRANYPGYVAPNHGQTSPDQYYPGPPQPLSPPAAAPLPSGWVAQFDPTTQRWYYIEQATGISRWEPPAYPAPYGQYGQAQVAQYGGVYPGQPNPYYGSQGSAMGPPQGGDYSHGGQHRGQESGSANKKMLLGAAGGLAAGAVGGALIGNALADSDDETHAAAATAPPASAPPPAALPPDETADGDSVSASDRESVLEARQEYEQAALAAQDSDASSSEEEALEEAREEYEEEYEETYDD